MNDHTWSVTYLKNGERTTERVIAESAVIGTDGCLAFGNGMTGNRPLITRAFASGVWLEFSLHT